MSKHKCCVCVCVCMCELQISKKERQGNKLLCGACGKRFLNVKAASIHTENKDHQIRLKVGQTVTAY